MKTIFLLKKLITIYYYLLLLAFGIGLVFFPMGLVLKPMFNMKPFGQNLTLDFSSTKEIILFALVLILAYLYVKAIYFLKCCLKDLFEGNYFTNLVMYKVTPGLQIGLSESLLSVSGENASWTQQTIDMSTYANHTVKLVFYHNAAGGTNADLQLDNIQLDGNTYDFEGPSTHSFQTTNSDTNAYDSASWSSLAVSTSNGRCH